MYASTRHAQSARGTQGADASPGGLGRRPAAQLALGLSARTWRQTCDSASSAAQQRACARAIASGTRGICAGPQRCPGQPSTAHEPAPSSARAPGLSASIWRQGSGRGAQKVAHHQRSTASAYSALASSTPATTSATRLSNLRCAERA